MDYAVLQIALFFLPGIIWANLDAKYGSGPKPKQFTHLIRAFVFGIATYAVLFFIFWVCGFDNNFRADNFDDTGINPFNLALEIALSVPLSFVLAILWLYSVKHRIMMKFLHYIGATTRFGDEDVWSFTLNSQDANVEYVHLRDFENGVVIGGWVNTYSENEDFREILLTNAIIYQDGEDKAEVIAEVPSIYISRPKGSIWLEFPFSSEEENVKERNTT